MRKLIDIVNEDATTAGSLISPAADPASKWNAEKEPVEATPESEALAELKAAHEKYMNVLQNSQAVAAQQHLQMLKKMKDILQWMS